MLRLVMAWALPLKSGMTPDYLGYSLDSPLDAGFRWAPGKDVRMVYAVALPSMIIIPSRKHIEL